jgi:hypothetical protein
LHSLPEDPDTASHIKHIFSKGYMKAKVEFAKKYRIKAIDWSSRDDKVRHTVPFWRTKSIPVPPTEAYNKFALAISEDIRAGSTSFVSEELKMEYNNFFKKPEAIIANMKEKAQESADVGNPEVNLFSSPQIRNDFGRPSSRNFEKSIRPDFTAPQNNRGGHRIFSRGHRRISRGRGSTSGQGWRSDNVGVHRPVTPQQNYSKANTRNLNNLLD